jgi:hypothetical protein
MQIDKPHITSLKELINLRDTLRQLMSTEGLDVTIRVIDGITMVQCPDGMFGEIQPNELDYIKNMHKVTVLPEINNE